MSLEMKNIIFSYFKSTKFYLEKIKLKLNFKELLLLFFIIILDDVKERIKNNHFSVEKNHFSVEKYPFVDLKITFCIDVLESDMNV